ncbi:MAG: NifU family protein [Bacilli bacterium]|nr:NifU family protein [Bacilli bacterium]
MVKKEKKKINTDEDKIMEVLNQLRPYINSEGGDLEFIKYEEDYVYIKLYGACATCGFRDFTIQDNIYEALKAEIPSLKGVINLEL